MVYKVVISSDPFRFPDYIRESFRPYIYNNGYIKLYWQHQAMLDSGYSYNCHGYCRPDFLKDVIGSDNWELFKKGVRIFNKERKIRQSSFIFSINIKASV